MLLEQKKPISSRFKLLRVMLYLVWLALSLKFLCYFFSWNNNRLDAFLLAAPLSL